MGSSVGCGAQVLNIIVAFDFSLSFGLSPVV